MGLPLLAFARLGGAIVSAAIGSLEAETIAPPSDHHELESLMENAAHTRSIDDVCSSVGLSDPEKGLEDSVARTPSDEDGGNDLTDAARPCPAWLCCLLPCLNNTKTKVEFRENIPRDAYRLWTDDRNPSGGTAPQLIDATGIVRGDVILVGAIEGGHHSADNSKIPADAIIFECSDDCRMERSVLREDLGQVKASTTPTDDNPLKSGNTALMGTTVVSGSLKAVVVAIGVNTQWAKIKYQSKKNK